MLRSKASLLVPITATLVIHGVLAAGLALAEQYLELQPRHDPITVKINIEPPPPPKKAELPPLPPPPPPPPEPPQKKPAPKPRPMSKPIEAPMPPQDVAREQPPEPPPEAKPAEQAPLEEAPPEEYTYRMPTTGGGGGTIAVSAGSGPTGSLYGRRGGTGNNKNASSDVAPPRPSVARVKRPPEQIGDYSRASRELYTEEARRAQVEGQVVLLLSVDESGRVAAVKLVKGLGYGLDEKAMAFGKTIRFRPAIDTEDRPIPYQLRWTFTFYIDD